MAATSLGGFRGTFADFSQLLKDSTRGKLSLLTDPPVHRFPCDYFFQREEFHVFPQELYLFLLCLDTFFFKPEN